MEVIKKYPSYKITEEGLVYGKRFNLPLSNRVDSRGYSQVALFEQGKRKEVLVHRLVAETFIPNPNKLPQVNHKDGNKQNNHKDNLEWSDNSKNQKHAYDTGLSTAPTGENHPMSKLNKEKVSSIRKQYNEGVSRKDLATKFKVSNSTIHLIVNNKIWKND